MYSASYSEGSTLLYNELIVISAIVRCASRFGVWISHIYVDNPDSVAGGREIWGLPKELAQFTWNHNNALSVKVSQGEQLLCELDCKWQLPGLQHSTSGSAFSVLNSKIMCFEGHGVLRWHLSNVDLQVPSDSHFAWLGITQPWLGFYLNPLRLTAGIPFLAQE